MCVRTGNVTRVLVTGAAGGLGRELLARLMINGYQVVGTSRRPDPGIGGVEWARSDITTGQGLDEALRGVDTVVHAASDGRKNYWKVDVEGTARLLEACLRTNVRHIIYPSIVGIDRIPMDYYKAKLAAEERIMSGGVAWTIQRAPQFFAFVDSLIASAARFPLIFLPVDWQGQPVDTGEAADIFADLVRRGPSGRTPDFGGPKVRKFGEMAREWKAARRVGKPIIGLPSFGAVAAGFRAGYNTVPGNRVGSLQWEDWLRAARF
jgi:uncharacterized protein YbjT (DUF2867 family)